MNIRTKIGLGFGVVLALLLILGGYANMALLRLDSTTRTIRQTNFYSVEVGQQLLSALDQMETAPTTPGGLPLFDKALAQAASNISEPGEQTVVDSLHQALTNYRLRLAAGASLVELTPHRIYLRSLAHRLVDLNIDALEAKSRIADMRAAESFRIMLALAALALVMTIGLVRGVAEAAAMPLEELTRAIEHATNNNFESTIPAEEYNDLGRVGRAFNRLLLELQEFRRSTLSELMIERNRLAGVVNSLDEGLLLLDQHAVIIMANPVVCRLLNRAPSELIGRSAAELAQQSELLASMLKPVGALQPVGITTADDLDAVADEEVSEEDNAETAPLLTVQISGCETYYRLTAHDLRAYDTSGLPEQSAGQLLTLRNVSDFKKLDQLKSDFLATVSHELKTPLASIGLSLKLLQHERTDAEERRRLAQGIGQETQRLQRMVGELLTVARLDAGSDIQLTIRPTSLAAVVRYAADTVRPQLNDKHLHLQVELPDDLPLVRADEEKTTWVLINLLSNAIRYSPDETALVVRATVHDGRVQVSVHDHGPGIAPDFQAHLFQRFSRIPDKTGYRGGTGLGLSIAREFIAAQGGRIWVESEPGQGSTFLFTLAVA